MLRQSFVHLTFGTGRTITLQSDGFFDPSAGRESQLKELVLDSMDPEGAGIVGGITLECDYKGDGYIATFFNNVGGVKAPIMTTAGAKTEEAGREIWAEIQDRFRHELGVSRMERHRPQAPFIADLVHLHWPDAQTTDFFHSHRCSTLCKGIGWLLLFSEKFDEYLAQMRDLDEHLLAWRESPEGVAVKAWLDAVKGGPDMRGKADRDEAMEEAVRRMEALGLAPEAISSFQKSGKLDSVMEGGRTVPLDEADQKLIQDFEAKSGCLAYAAVRSDSGLGRMMSYIVVSSYKDDWPLERMNIGQGNVLAYVHNYGSPRDLELGTIGIEKVPGGTLKRTW